MGMKNSYNKIFKKQVKNLIPAVRKKAIIQQVVLLDVDTGVIGSLSISFVDNPQTIIKNVPVANSVYSGAGNTVAVGSRCVVDIFDETNSNDMVVVYTY
jgi:hypothetical protein